MPEARLTLAGPVMPDIDLPALRTRAEEIGQVDLRPGYVPMEELPALFGSHRVVMFTYETVNISGSIHMAFTFGRPVVATDVGAMADNVQDGRTGLLVAPDPEAVARAMITLLDPETADTMGAAAAEHAEQDASWSGVADKAVAAYRSALADRA
jgi:glycosyltransferase involved in cell wall biosynthesis